MFALSRIGDVLKKIIDLRREGGDRRSAVNVEQMCRANRNVVRIVTYNQCDQIWRFLDFGQLFKVFGTN